MPTTDQDLRALTYLARRLRDETHGCAQWDEAGTFACLKDAYAGQNLLLTIQRLIGHACDPDARTPGAVKRPFTPDLPPDVPPRIPYDPRKVCHICGHREHEHNRDTHEFVSVAAARGVRSSPAPESIRAAIAEGPRTWPPRASSTTQPEGEPA